LGLVCPKVLRTQRGQVDLQSLIKMEPQDTASYGLVARLFGDGLARQPMSGPAV
jgi:hypothetical protein